MKKSMNLPKVMRSYQCMGPPAVESDTEEELNNLNAPMLHKRMRQSSSSSDEGCGGGATEISREFPRCMQRSRSGISFMCVNFRGAKRRRNLVTLSVGKERTIFKVEPHLLEHVLFQCLIEKTKEETKARTASCDSDEIFGRGDVHVRDGGLLPGAFDSIISLNCDAILIEHLLWLVDNNDPSLRQLNIDELMEFYV